MCVSACGCVRACGCIKGKNWRVCVCARAHVCVCERERERAGGGGGVQTNFDQFSNFLSVGLSVFLQKLKLNGSKENHKNIEKTLNCCKRSKMH